MWLKDDSNMSAVNYSFGSDWLWPSVWPPPLQELPVGGACGHVEGSGVNQQLTAWGQKHKSALVHHRKTKSKHSFQTLTLPAVELGELREPHVIADPNTHFAERCRRNTSDQCMLIQTARQKARVCGCRSRVSNSDKLLPGLSVSDSWKRIFPGTSMSNKWILEEERKKMKRIHLCNWPHTVYDPHIPSCV